MELPSTGDITVVHDARVADMIRRCYSDIEVKDREGSRGRGVTNLKRIFGWPTDLPVAVDALASTVAGEAQAGGPPPIAEAHLSPRSLPSGWAYPLSLCAVCRSNTCSPTGATMQRTTLGLRATVCRSEPPST